MRPVGDADMEDLESLKRAFVQAARRAYTIGLQTGNGGNLSARLPGRDLVLIKPNGLSFGECSEANLVGTTLEGEVVLGEGTPSRELRTHLAVYRLRDDVNGIVHCHCPWAIACAAALGAPGAPGAPGAFGTLPLHTYHAELKLGPVPVLTVEGHADETVAREVQRLMREQPGVKAFLQARHGIFALGASVIEAEHTAELVQETAQIAWLLAGHPASAGKGKASP